MIEAIHISNFQSHKKTTLQLGKGINVIIGQSDSGKSAIIRALNWLINNKPLGESFRSHWGGDTEVAITDTNNVITRTRSNKVNQYSAIWDWEAAAAGCKDEEIFEAMKSEVPDEIVKALGFEEINTQFQMDSPFLLGETAGEVARKLNQIVNLEVIDTTLSNIEKMRRESNRLIQNGEEQITKQKEELSQFDYLEEMEKKINSLFKIQNSFSEAKSSYTRCFDMIGDAKAYTEQIQGAEKKCGKVFAKKVQSLLDLIEDISSLDSKYGNIVAIDDEYEHYQTEIEDNTFDPKLNKVVDSYLQKVSTLGSIKKNREAVSDLLEQYRFMKEEIDDLDEKLITKREEEKKLTPDICPLCGGKIK